MVRISKFVLASTLVLTAPAARAADDYVPTREALARLSVDQALSLVNSTPNLPNAIKMAGESMVLITGVKFSPSHITISDENRRNSELKLDGARINVSYGGFLDPEAIAIDGNLLYYYNLNDKQLRNVADAIYVLRNAAAAGSSPGSDAAFAQVVASYRAADPKPQIPEEVRRFKVEAEGAIEDKDFAGAAAYYGRALALAPWWPAGHYDRAVVLAEIGEYETAMGEMQRYLLLAPDATDARAAQDLVYNWERKLRTQTATVPLPAPIPAQK